MADPISTGAGQMAEKMLEEVAKASSQADQLQQAQNTQGPQFNQVLDAQRVGEVQEIRPGAVDVLGAARMDQGAVPVPAMGRTLDRSPVASGVQRIMEDVMQGQNKLEEIINLSMSGRNFSTPELLALQAGVYRFTQELELTSKVVEKGTSTIKQTMNTQV